VPHAIDFYYDIVCPYAYLASTQIEELAQRIGAPLHYRPILLGGVFRNIDAPLVPMDTMPESKRRMNQLDLARWAEHFGQPLNFPDSHPQRTVEAMRCVLASPKPVKTMEALFRAYWVEGRNVTDLDVLRTILQENDLAPDSILEDINSTPIKDQLKENTAGAVKAGVFGVPAFMVNGELIWGQDRLHFVEKLALGWRPSLQ